jgi:histidyl-tRNA synthetase
MSKSLIQPRTLKGFRDYLPSQMIAREHLMAIAREVYRSYGFSPIDTPALEYTEILLGKGGEETDRQLFRFRDQGDRDVAMRFDLTVPLARFAAEHLNEIGTPFKRYHIGTVWRAENPQKGRFREFMQCDFDTIGTESNASDIETLLVIHDLMERIGFSRFTIRVNNRLVLNGLLEAIGLTAQTAGVWAADKLPKVSADAW